MKRVVFFIFFILLFSHCGRPNYPKIDASFERLDTSLLAYIDEQGHFLPDGSYIEIEERENTEEKPYYICYRTPSNSYYTVIKEYYHNGNSYRKYISLNTRNNLFNTDYYFKENGEIEKIVNHDIECPFTFDKILTFCKKKGISNIPKGAINYTLPKNTTTILKMSYKENTIWFIEWKKTNGSSELFFIDGNTGKLIEHRHGYWSFGDRIN